MPDAILPAAAPATPTKTPASLTATGAASSPAAPAATQATGAASFPAAPAATQATGAAATPASPALLFPASSITLPTDADPTPTDFSAWAGLAPDAILAAASVISAVAPTPVP